ncbi:carbon-nitrogen hydrolase family protein [Citricoccus sp. GCM10030269]|uniref:carbon-nitrogen hydrolase family protein n=1 Tax=Citricoccus sp. GCM10030269 TaxID=3273388 RepID=UPI00360AA754
MSITIALAQISATPDVESNLGQIRDWTARAAQSGARLVLFPEASTCSFDGDLAAFAREESAAAHERIAAWAAEFGVAIVVGSFSSAPSSSASVSSAPSNPGDDRILNTTIAALPDGRQYSYDKIHLFDAFGHRESDTVAPGNQTTVFSFEGLTFGLATCYDIRFPELFTTLAREGAEVILLGASWGDGPGKADQWTLLSRARALDSTTWMAAVGQCPRDPATAGTPTSSPLGVGLSALVAPDGTDTARLGLTPELALVEIDAERVQSTRAGIPVLENARLRS